MKRLTQHIAVFAAGLGITALAAFLMPLSTDPRDVFFVFLAVFFVYLGISTFIQARRMTGGRKRKN